MIGRSREILVPDAHALGSIAVIRSLGSSGHSIHALSDSKAALGFRSSFTKHSAIHPSYSSPHFLDWLEQYVKKQGIEAIVPSEGFLLAIRSRLSRFRHLIPIQASEEALYGAYSKFDVLRSLQSSANPEVKAHLPATLFVHENSIPDPSILSGLGFPLFLKADSANAKSMEPGIILSVSTQVQLKAILEILLEKYSRLIVQEHVPGQDVGVYILKWEGVEKAHFMNKAVHAVPHTGGFYSLRESVWIPEIYRDAYLKLDHLNWNGAAMLEYRWKPKTGQYWFIEINARFWASLHHALYAGVDFPKLLLDCHFGFDVAPVQNYKLGLKCRYTFPADAGHVLSRFSDPNISIASKLSTLFKFIGLFLHPRIKSDLSYPGDRKLYWLQLIHYFGQQTRDLIDNSLGKKQL